MFKVGETLLLHDPGTLVWAFDEKKFYPSTITCEVVYIAGSKIIGVIFNKKDIPNNITSLHRLERRLKDPLGWWLDLIELKSMGAIVVNNAFQGPMPKYHKISVKVKELQKKFEERQHVTR